MSAPTNAPVLASDVLAWVTPCVDGSGLARVARVVRVVAVDDAMVERAMAAVRMMRADANAMRLALTAALTPPEA